MKKVANRVVLLIVFLVAQQEILSACIPPRGETRQILKYCFRVWEAGAYGRDSSGTESAAWIIRSQDNLVCRKWPATNARRRQVWHLPKPEAAVAIVHTHPDGLDPKPSAGDARLARRIHAEVFSISRQGVWKVSPDGAVTCEAGSDWYRDLEQQDYEPCE